MNNWVGLSLSVPPEFDAQWAIWTTIEVQCFKDFISILNIKNSSEFHWIGSSVDIFQCDSHRSHRICSTFFSIYFPTVQCPCPPPHPGLDTLSPRSHSTSLLLAPGPGPSSVLVVNTNILDMGATQIYHTQESLMRIRGIV